jgi:Cft2 family RNA processing exonuclease
MRLTFLGAAGEVTGSCFLVDTGDVKFLLDCGMFQGGRSAVQKNRRFAFEPSDIAFVLLSHAHIDHSGLIPRLVAQGFAGAVYATRATCDLLGVMLPDSAHLQEKEAEREGTPRIHFTESVEDSMRINSIRSGAVIISASGMCDGGRVRHHLRYNLQRPECAVVFAGFQAAGTLGRRIVDGAKSVRLFGEQVAVRAKVFTIGGLSAHADRNALLGWLGRLRRAPRACCVVHGEPLAAHALRDEIERRYRWQASVPAQGQSVALEAGR